MKDIHKEIERISEEPKKCYRVARDHQRDLKFNGWLIGGGEVGAPGDFSSQWNCGTDIDIYVTTGLNVVIGLVRWSAWEGSPTTHEGTLIHVTGSFDDIYDWAEMAGPLVYEELKRLSYDDPELAMEEGDLSSASKEAWESVAEKFFPDELCEEIA